MKPVVRAIEWPADAIAYDLTTPCSRGANAVTLKIVYGLVSTIATLLWMGTLVGNWGARTYQRLGAESKAWFWLRQFDVPVNQANCVTFMRMVSLAGISFALVTNIALWIA
jgi:hypothetical protein